MKRSMRRAWWIIPVILWLVSACGSPPKYDVVLLNGTIVDGTGNPGYQADVGIRGETIAVIGDLEESDGVRAIDATGLVVAPGFIDMMGQSEFRLLRDGRAQSKVHQGITTEVTGEGSSVAPIEGPAYEMVRAEIAESGDSLTWTSLNGYFERLVEQGISINVATFVGAASVRTSVIGSENRPPSAQELEWMMVLVQNAMNDGALGLSSALIYPPGFFASTEELVALARTVSESGGIYATHMRSEGNAIFASLDETIRIAREADIPVEIFHLKVAGKDNWDRLESVLELIENARLSGLDIQADVYPYTAASTGLAASLPPWAQEGGREAFLARLRSPSERRRIRREMLTPSDSWENFFLGSEKIMVSSMPEPGDIRLEGLYIRDIAAERNQDPVDTVLDLLVSTEARRIDCVFFMMSEENVRTVISQPWVSFCCDAGARALEGPLHTGKPHPRAYGTFPRVLGKYVREEGLISLEEAVRKMTSLPAGRVGLADRGRLETGLAADIVCFDPNTVIDTATYEDPHQYPVGIDYVVVNGTVVVDGGRHTGQTPGRPLYGPGRVGR